MGGCFELTDSWTNYLLGIVWDHQWMHDFNHVVVVILINAYPCWSFTAPITFKTRGQPWESVSPDPWRTCKTHSNCLCLTSPCGTEDSSDNGPSRSSCNFWKTRLLIYTTWIRLLSFNSKNLSYIGCIVYISIYNIEVYTYR